VAIEMSDREFGARGVVGGTGQYTGRGIRNSLIGKAVVALNGMFGYSSQLSKASANMWFVCVCAKVRTQHVITCERTSGDTYFEGS